jgi:hypothetical protein
MTKAGCNFGNKGGGRPKDRIREKCLQGFEKHGLPYCLKVLSGEEPGDPLKAADMLGKYGGLTQVDVTSGDEPITKDAAVAQLAAIFAAKGTAEVQTD